MSGSPSAWMALEDGTVLAGGSVGAAGERGGDIVFNTAMTGYHEILTDPSYHGQVVVMTYPLIGNYGVAGEDDESPRAWAEAFVIKEMSSLPSNRRATASLPDWLRAKGIVAIEGVDTRRLTKTIRTHGSLRCVVSTVDSDPASLLAKARAMPSTDGRDLTLAVTCDAPYRWTDSYDASYPAALPAATGPAVRCVAIDFGAKRNILRSLVHSGFDVTVVPARSSAADVRARSSGSAWGTICSRSCSARGRTRCPSGTTARTIRCAT
jgi:carbamoyl-phosphate synthase small subunit